MPADVIVIGLDAAEATLVERWAAEGDLPTFARLGDEGAVCRLGNSLESLPGAIWPEITMGRACGKVAHFYHPRQLHTGETRLRAIEYDEVDPSLYYWSVASEAGRRVAVVDQPQTVLTPGLNGIHLLEWGLHDRNFRIQSEPPELLDEIRSRYGDHPVDSCDRAHGSSAGGYERLLADLLAGVEKKEALLLDLLGREPWDLFACAFGETHCVGHQFWHFQDPRVPAHDPAAPRELRQAIRAVYRRVDAAIGELLEAAGPDSAALVVLSHGMGRYIGGYQLLPEFLVRLGFGSGRGTAAQVRSRLPRPLRSLARRVVPGRARQKLQTAAGSLSWPLESTATRAIAVPNNRCGAIRLNLKGREPYGAVEPGLEEQALLEELRQELLALEDPATGERIVVRAVTATEKFGRDRHPDTPDLMVVFRTDLGLIEHCRSERVGLLHVPVDDPNTPRTGDHTVESRLWIRDGSISGGTRLPDACVLDIGPTVLELLGVPVPETMDGRTLLPATAEA